MSALPSASAPPTFRPAQRRAHLLRTALAYGLLIAIARGVTFLGAAWLTDHADRPESRYVGDLLIASDVFSVALLVIAAVSWLLWVAWTSRLEENALELGAEEGRIGPRGAIGWWLVPVANLIVPCAELMSLDRRLASDERGTHELLIGAWWVALLVTTAGVVATSVLLAVPATSSMVRADEFAAIGIVSLLASVASLLAIRAVGAVQAEERSLANSAAAAWRFAPPIPLVGAEFASDPGYAEYADPYAGGSFPGASPYSPPYGQPVVIVMPPPAGQPGATIPLPPPGVIAPVPMGALVPVPSIAPGVTYPTPPGPMSPGSPPPGGVAPMAPPSGGFMVAGPAVPVAYPAPPPPVAPGAVITAVPAGRRRRGISWMLVAAVVALGVALVAGALIPLDELGLGPGVNGVAGRDRGPGRQPRCERGFGVPIGCTRINRPNVEYLVPSQRLPRSEQLPSLERFPRAERLPSLERFPRAERLSDLERLGGAECLVHGERPSDTERVAERGGLTTDFRESPDEPEPPTIGRYGDCGH